MAVDLLSIAEVLKQTGLSERTFYRVRQRGEFPEPVRLSTHKRVVLWRSDDVHRWVEWNMPRRRVHRDP